MAESIRTMDLRYATITGVTRDDLPDEGAWLYAETVRQVHALAPGTGVEILTPDFSGRRELLGQVFDAAPEVFAHNLETVPRIFRRIRPAFSYDKSLDVLAQGRAAGMVTKSNLILGMGETRAEVSAGAARHARRRLRPRHHHPVPAADAAAPPGGSLGEAGRVRRAPQEAEEIGFAGVMSGPLVRSSYRAGRCTGRGAAHARASRAAGPDAPADEGAARPGSRGRCRPG